MPYVEATLLQVQSGPCLLTRSGRSERGLGPVPVQALTLLAASGLENLP